jgi:hypothetical protein
MTEMEFQNVRVDLWCLWRTLLQQWARGPDLLEVAKGFQFPNRLGF